MHDPPLQGRNQILSKRYRRILQGRKRTMIVSPDVLAEKEMELRENHSATAASDHGMHANDGRYCGRT